MLSFKQCEDLKRELRDLLLEGNNLSKRDVNIMFDCISKLHNPTEILEHIIDLKQDGNFYFKKGELDDALEQYDLTGVFLTCIDVKEETDRVSFFDLASSIMLNMAACLLKKMEFVQVGLLCTIVLDYNPNNVKARFRRACAAMEVGRNDFALGDLRLACKAEPSNKEVAKKLHEVENLLQNQSGKCDLDHVALGSNLNSSKSRKTSTDGMLEEKHKHDAIDVEVSSDLETSGGFSCVTVSNNTSIETMNRVNGELTAEVDQGVEQVSKDNSLLNEVVMKEATTTNEKCQRAPGLMEPKYQFRNRKRHGSSLTITKKDYHRLAQGKSIQLFNPKSGITMSIKLVDCPRSIREREGSPVMEVSPSPPTQVCDYQTEQETIDEMILESPEEVADNFSQNHEPIDKSKGSILTETLRNQLEGAINEHPASVTPSVYKDSPGINHEHVPVSFQSTSSVITGQSSCSTTIMTSSKARI